MRAHTSLHITKILLSCIFLFRIMSSNDKDEKKTAEEDEVESLNRARDEIFSYDQEVLLPIACFIASSSLIFLLQEIDKHNKEKPWTNNVEFYNSCKISALAAMKMLKHALAGVAKGIKWSEIRNRSESILLLNSGRASQGGRGQPIEIMGLLVGKPLSDGRKFIDVDQVFWRGTHVFTMQILGTIVVMDAYPLPVEGIEYKVEAAEEANMYMIQLLEALELRRKER